MKQFHIKDNMQVEVRWEIQLESILTHSLIDGVRLVAKRFELSSGSYESLFLLIQPHLVINLELMLNPMMVLLLLVIGIGFCRIL